MLAKQSDSMFGVEKFLSVCFWLLTLSGTTAGHDGPGVNTVFVKQDSDVVLNCSLGNKDIRGMIFDWRKNGQRDGQKEVFLYDAGEHYNNGRPGQDEQFKGRVSHFQDQLMNGNASIKIQNTTMADSGTYSCDFPHHSQTFYIELVVERNFKDRSGEIIGTCPKPYIEILDATEDGSLLQCEVQGASSEPKVEWQDSAGNILPAEEPQVSERGGRYYVTLNITVTKTDHYSCVATQQEISHRIHAKTFVIVSENQSSVSGKLCEDPSTKVAIGWLGGVVIGVVVLAAVLALLVVTKRITVICNQGPCQQRNDYKAAPGEAGTP